MLFADPVPLPNLLSLLELQKSDSNYSPLNIIFKGVFFAIKFLESLLGCLKKNIQGILFTINHKQKGRNMAYNYYQTHKEKCKEKMKEYQQAHKEEHN